MNWPMIMLMQVFLCIGCFLVSSVNGYQIGLGRADCTGPPVEVVFVSLSWFQYLIFPFQNICQQSNCEMIQYFVYIIYLSKLFFFFAWT